MSASAAKARFYIAAQAADACSLAEFEAIENWIEVSDFASIEGLGEETEVIAIDIDQASRPLKRKHYKPVDDPITITFVRSTTDAGQAELKEAREELVSRAFKLTTQTSAPIYFSGLTAAYRLQLDADAGVILRVFNIDRTSNIEEAAA